MSDDKSETMTPASRRKQTLVIDLSTKLREAVGSAIELENQIYIAEGGLSADYRFLCGLEQEMQRVLDRLQWYRDQLPQVHPMYKKRGEID